MFISVPAPLFLYLIPYLHQFLQGKIQVKKILFLVLFRTNLGYKCICCKFSIIFKKKKNGAGTTPYDNAIKEDSCEHHEQTSTKNI